jgi:hypothetical protein
MIEHSWSVATSQTSMLHAAGTRGHQHLSHAAKFRVPWAQLLQVGR